ncbi:MAG: extracellular solute-binding protein [Melioribacter sp.]|uniref:extracellular solute-binding protein n=1 Tax=Rosettibacter primus TaxID=3111523 RepID=UPI00247DDFC7|nr:extracellular solute-binding protein [Melioribacter sp.]
MKKITKSIKESSIWLISIFISLVAIFFFIYLPFQINLFSKSSVKKIYYVDNISPAHLKIINRFNKLHKNEIEVVPVNLPFYHFTTNDRKAILTRSLRNRSDGIDVFAVDLIWIPRFAKWGYSMDKYFDEQTLSNVNKMALKAGYQNDSLVAFPLFLDVGVLYYRRDLILKLPNGKEIEKKIQNSLTWDEFFSLGEKFSSYEKPFYIFQGGEFEGMVCNFHELLCEEESNKIFNNYHIDLRTEAAHKALKQLVDLIHKYKYSPYEVTRMDEYLSYLYANENNAVFLRGWVGFHKQYKNFLKDTSNVKNLAIAPLPHFKGCSTSGVFGGWSLMISKFSDRKEEALKFIKFMFEKENQKILYEEGGVIPVNEEVFNDSLYLKNHKELVQIKNLLKWGKHRPFLENYTRISEILARQFHKALKKEITIQEALDYASTQINNEKAIVKK